MVARRSLSLARPIWQGAVDSYSAPAATAL